LGRPVHFSKQHNLFCYIFHLEHRTLSISSLHAPISKIYQASKLVLKLTFTMHGPNTVMS